MKREGLASIANGINAHLISRNNSIDGFWGIGILCAIAKYRSKYSYSFDVIPGENIVIAGCTLQRSLEVTEKLKRFNLNAIGCKIRFKENGIFDNNESLFICSLTTAVSCGKRVGIDTAQTYCWPHNQMLERRSAFHKENQYESYWVRLIKNTII